MVLFHYLKYGLALILAFIGVKMLLPILGEEVKIPIGVSLGVIAGVLVISILASIFFKRKDK
jgi:tellurite resistance protein TerC